MSGGVRVEARAWGWRHAGRRTPALSGVDLVIEPGERVLLLGPSGAGKSTLLAALAGLLDATGGGEATGSLTVDGRDPREARDRSGLVLQDPGAQIIMARAGDDVAFGLENRCVPRAEIWPRVDAALDAVAFPYRRGRPTHALSGGEQQRLVLAGTVALRPDLLLLDEPTANLDPQNAAAVRDVIRHLVAQRATTMVLVEHRVADVLPLVDRVVVLAPGAGVVAAGAPGEVFRRHGTQLAEAGVWVPDRPPAAPLRRPRPPSQTLVAAEAVTFRYPGSTTDALDPSSVALRAAEALGITGPNGSGKSTLALLLAGLLRPSRGSVTAGESLAAGRAGSPIWRWPARDLVTRIGTVFQDPEHQFLAPTVRDELRIGPLRAGLPADEIERRTTELLERLRLGHLAEANPFTLSGGEKRRLSVATALATAPRALVLDEPTFGQDRRTWAELLYLLAALRDEGSGVAFVSHDAPFVEALADRTHVMAR
ncbi:MAG: ATP-binding cassette domain-containing protein [Chloroflexota bacterium]